MRSSAKTLLPTTSLAYDFIMNQFIITIQKQRDTKRTSITFSERELVGQTEKFLIAIAVGNKYASRETGSIDIPFELMNNKTGGTAAVLFVRDSGYSKTGIVIDIRKCGKNSSGVLSTPNTVLDYVWKPPRKLTIYYEVISDVSTIR